MEQSAESVRDEFFPVIIVTRGHGELVIDCLPKWHVKNLKWAIQKRLEVSPKEQRLFFAGIELEEPDYLLSLYGIEPQLAGHPAVDLRVTLMEIYKGIPQTYFLDEAHYDQKWHCSYEGIIAKKPQQRGGKAYYQPIGCVRYGLKVLGKYENDAWLGGKGYRTEDEWPVAYHGTKELNVLEILRKGFLLEKGVHGKGTYCTPDPRVALGYAFHYEFNDEPYKLIIQCRVDPKRLQIFGSHWLVPDGTAIRPYGICVYSKKGCEELEKQFNGVGMSVPRGGYTFPGMSWSAQTGGGGASSIQQQPVHINPSNSNGNPTQLNQQQTNTNGSNAAPHDQQVPQQQPAPSLSTHTAVEMFQNLLVFGFGGVGEEELQERLASMFSGEQDVKTGADGDDSIFVDVKLMNEPLKINTFIARSDKHNNEANLRKARSAHAILFAYRTDNNGRGRRRKSRFDAQTIDPQMHHFDAQTINNPMQMNPGLNADEIQIFSHMEAVRQQLHLANQEKEEPFEIPIRFCVLEGRRLGPGHYQRLNQAIKALRGEMAKFTKVEQPNEPVEMLPLNPPGFWVDAQRAGPGIADAQAQAADPSETAEPTVQMPQLKSEQKFGQNGLATPPIAQKEPKSEGQLPANTPAPTPAPIAQLEQEKAAPEKRNESPECQKAEKTAVNSKQPQNIPDPLDQTMEGQSELLSARGKEEEELEKRRQLQEHQKRVEQSKQRKGIDQSDSGTQKQQPPLNPQIAQLITTLTDKFEKRMKENNGELMAQMSAEIDRKLREYDQRKNQDKATAAAGWSLLDFFPFNWFRSNSQSANPNTTNDPADNDGSSGEGGSQQGNGQ